MLIRDRIVDFRRVKPSDIRPAARNWRKHPTEQHDALRAVLAEIGFAGASLARLCPDGSLEYIDGHLRAETMPDQPIPTLVTDLTEEEAVKFLAVYDRIGAMAEMDSEALAALLKECDGLGDELTKLAWPDYVRDPLLAADWSPGNPSDDPPGVGNKHSGGTAITLNDAQRLIFERAASEVRAAQGAELGDADCVVFLCERFLQEIKGKAV